MGRSGAMIDKFNGKGGDGGSVSDLNCGAGYKIAGYLTLVDSQVISTSGATLSQVHFGRAYVCFLESMFNR